MKTFKTIKEIIDKKISLKTEEYSMFLLIEKEFKKTQTKSVYKNLKIHDYEKGELFLKAQTAAWRNEGSLIKDQIKKNF
tara:strand:+ start:185 stop:421 length:237 start_codon:yes stop_codon:yes gene_type:complete